MTKFEHMNRQIFLFSDKVTLKTESTRPEKGNVISSRIQ